MLYCFDLFVKKSVLTIEPLNGSRSSSLIVIGDRGLAFALSSILVLVDPDLGLVGLLVVLDYAYAAEFLLYIAAGHVLGQVLNEYGVALSERVAACVKRLATVVATRLVEVTA